MIYSKDLMKRVMVVARQVVIPWQRVDLGHMMSMR